MATIGWGKKFQFHRWKTTRTNATRAPFFDQRGSPGARARVHPQSAPHSGAARLLPWLHSNRVRAALCVSFPQAKVRGAGAYGGRYTKKLY